MKGLDLTKIFDSMKDNEISELIIKEGSRLYEIRRGGFKQNIVAGAAVASAQPVVQNMQQPVQVVPQASQNQVNVNSTATASDKAAETKAEEVPSNLYELTAPLVGTFYSSPKPDSPNFVQIGDKVKKGQVLCIVEAMKNFNEIESDVDGVIKEICVNNEELVEFGKVLFKIELS